MRRKGTRGTGKKSPASKKPTRRTSKRRKRQSSESSYDSNDDLQKTLIESTKASSESGSEDSIPLAALNNSRAAPLRRSGRNAGEKSMVEEQPPKEDVETTPPIEQQVQQEAEQGEEEQVNLGTGKCNSNIQSNSDDTSSNSAEVAAKIAEEPPVIESSVEGGDNDIKKQPEVEELPVAAEETNKQPFVAEESPKDYEKEDSVGAEDKSCESTTEAPALEAPETPKQAPTESHKEEPKSTKKLKLIRTQSEDVPVARASPRTWKTAIELPTKFDVETLRKFCPNLQFVSEDEVKLETKSRRRSSVETKPREDSPNRPEFLRENSETNGDEVAPSEEEKANIIAMNRKISIVEDTASKLKPPPSPAKNPVSEVLFITNLVRPFTIKQLKELLERTGKIVEEGFWTDRIKSKCYAQYESAEEAEATRNALHGVNWPIGNGKKLIIEYATVEDLDKAKNPPVAAEPPPAVTTPAQVHDKSSTLKENNVNEPNHVSGSDRNKSEGVRKDDLKRAADNNHRQVREWDLGKDEHHKRKSRSRSRDRGRKVTRRSITPEDYISRKQRKMEDAVPQKLMDDLFLKTKATPSIYWKPLSPEEIATKQQQRLIRMEEHKRRMEETRVRTNSGGGGRGGGPSYRRR